MLLELDDFYFENLLDLLEGRRKLPPELKEITVKQGRRILKIHRAKMEKRMVGAPRKEERL